MNRRLNIIMLMMICIILTGCYGADNTSIENHHNATTSTEQQRNTNLFEVVSKTHIWEEDLCLQFDLNYIAAVP